MIVGRLRGSASRQASICATSGSGRSGRPDAERRQGLADLAGGLGRSAARDGVLARPRLVEGERERVDVRLGAGVVALGLLGRHVGERADDLAGRGERRGARDRGDSEVHELRAAALRSERADDRVLRLHVAVDDAALVGVAERVAEVLADLGDVAVGDGALARGAVERLSLDELGDEEGVAVALAQLVQRDDRRVVEARRRLGLAQDAIGARGLDLLDRDLALEALVEGLDRRCPSRRSRFALRP